jgi:N-acetylmuramoyl-L-alanine amidase
MNSSVHAGTVGLTGFCISNAVSARFQTALGYLTLEKAGREVRVFLTMPYVASGGEIHYVKEIPGFATNGEIRLPDDTALLVKTLLEQPAPEVSVSSMSTVAASSSVASSREVFLDPKRVLYVSSASNTVTNWTGLRTSPVKTASSAARPSSSASSVKAISASRNGVVASKAADNGDFRPIDAVVIDPGHGGHDPGGIGVNGEQEKEIVLDVAKLLYDELRSRGIQTLILTRKTDVFVSLADRAKITAEAAKKKNAIFVSVHGNISLDRDIRGLEVYSLADRASDKEAQSVEFAENAQFSSADVKKAATVLDILSDLFKDEVRRESDVFARCVAESYVPATGCELRGVKKANFYVLRYSPVPSILVETGFMSNPSESKKLMDKAYRAKMAAGIAGGVENYIKEYERTRGFTK